MRTAHPHRRPLHRGFTLPELLVVVSIILVLLSLTCSAVRMVRESAYGVKCMSNLRQCGLASYAYGQDFRDKVATIKRSYPLAQQGMTYIWMHLITPYAEASKGAAENRYRKNTVIDGCPKYRTNPAYDTLNMGYGQAIFLLRPSSISYVNGLDANDDPCATTATFKPVFRDFRFAALSNPSSRLLIGDRDNGATTGSDLWNGGQCGFRHRGRANGLMCDLHCETLDRPTAMLATEHPELR